MENENMDINISTLFNYEPKQWGLRGDQHLWDEMRIESRQRKLLENEELMEKYFYDLFYELTGYEITTKKQKVLIKHYPRYGMSGGYISTEWWIKNGIPFIMERYKKIKLANEGIKYEIKDIYYKSEIHKGSVNSIEEAVKRILFVTRLKLEDLFEIYFNNDNIIKPKIILNIKKLFWKAEKIMIDNLLMEDTMGVYRKQEKQKAEALINTGWFNNDVGNGNFSGHNYPFVLSNCDNNIYQPILSDVKEYFNKNKIAWWKGKEPTGHTLSSQIACINHLFLLRYDKEAVLSLLSTFSSNFVDVLEIITDEYAPAFISFEQISDDDHLNEGKPTRGSNCTSIDACVYAVHKDGSYWLIPIEWKYTETYNDENKGIGSSGETRHKRYDGLIHQSSQLIYDKIFDEISIYYFEPFYQLMRQTLWAEQIVNNKKTERICVDNYMHIHVIPYKNIDLLEKTYSCSKMNMSMTWRSCLVDQSKYKIISPEILLGKLNSKYDEFRKYLSKRYWE
jgi:hypothetical protein